MAKPKLTVAHAGTIIGTRRTDRPYLFAVAAVAFDEAKFAEHAMWAWMRSADERASTLEHYREAQHPTYRHANQHTDEHRARYAFLAANPAAFTAERYEWHVKQWNNYRKLDSKPHVRTWHTRVDLAQRELERLAPLYPYLTLAILPVFGAGH